MAISATCWSCGDIDLAIMDVVMTVHPYNHDLDFYEYACPTDGCGEPAKEPLPEHVYKLLRSIGVAELIETRPDEYGDEIKTFGLPLSEDDLIEFGRSLEADDGIYMRIELLNLRYVRYPDLA